MSTVAKTGSRRLDQLERDIELGIQSVGKALSEIHSTKAYKEQYDTFELYCKTRWGFTDRYARDLIDAESVRSKIGTLVLVSDIKTKHLVALSKVPPAKQAQVAASVIAEAQAENRTPTEKDFKEAAKEFVVEKQQSKPAKPTPEPEPDVWEDVEDEPEPQVKPSKPLPKTVMSQSPQELVANIHAAGETLLALVKEVNRLADQVGGEWIDCQEVETRASSLRKLIRGFAHWVDCPKCKGKGCNDCKRIGWLSVERKQFLSQEMKDLLGV